MQVLELQERDLPVQGFVSDDALREPTGSHVRSRPSFRDGTFWASYRKAGQALTWRGRSYVKGTALARHLEIDLIDVIRLEPSQVYVAPLHPACNDPSSEYYLISLHASPGTRLSARNEQAPLVTGCLWKLPSGPDPWALRGGRGVGLHLMLALSGRQTSKACAVQQWAGDWLQYQSP